jgi:energy-coupling factor transporter ATP-binding protein EcfA2
MRGSWRSEAMALFFKAFNLMQIDITIKNYRCFPDTNPATIRLQNGFTAFVGVNNSGKTTLLRFLYEFRWLFQALGNESQYDHMVMGRPQGIAGIQEVPDPEQLFHQGNRNGIGITIEHANAEQDQMVSRVDVSLNREQRSWSARFHTRGRELKPEEIQRAGGHRVGGGILQVNGRPIADFAPFFATCRALADAYYVPSFRHLSAFSPTQGSFNNYYDINVGRPFIDMWVGQQSGTSLQGRRQIHRLIEEIKEIFEFRELQITPSMDRNTLQLIVDGRHFNLHELGSGLTQFILVLGNAAFRKSSFILIDEPELNLHPSLQVKFLMKLAGYASEGILFATHNIGLARSIAEQTYAVVTDRAGTRVTQISDTPRLAELLGELNYEGYRPLGFNKLLLVEGRTSFKVFVELLRLINKDHEFLVVPMSDSINRNSKEELQEVMRICPNVYAVIDSERQNPGEMIEAGRAAFQSNCQTLGIHCHILERRAIENYMPDRAVKAAMGQAHRALGPYEGRQGISLWSKKDNWMIARQMERAELETTDLGRFLISI